HQSPFSRQCHCNLHFCNDRHRSNWLLDRRLQLTYVLFITERTVMAVIGRPRGFDRDAALEAAMFLFWRKGFEATSMNDLCDAMGVRSPSLYAAFESKEALYLAAFEHYVATEGQAVWDKLGEGATARAGVENLLIGMAEAL